MQAFSEGNGNEHRNSYHGFANGIAQLIHSPTEFTNNAMIINTNKRLTNDNSPGPIGGPLCVTLDPVPFIWKFPFETTQQPLK
jgi:hypothetical protein